MLPLTILKILLNLHDKKKYEARLKDFIFSKFPKLEIP